MVVVAVVVVVVHYLVAMWLISMLSPPPPLSRPKTRSCGGDDGYMHEEVEIAPDGENGNDHEYGTNEEPEPDARPAQRTKKLVRRNGPISP